jgi:hypothetical protein
MAMVKSAKAAQLRRAAERMDWLMANARILRSPALWEKYYEAQRMIRLLGFEVTLEGDKHRVTPC